MNSEASEVEQVGGVPSGSEALFLAERAAAGDDILFLAIDDVTIARTRDALGFFAPGLRCLTFPAWDCLPYDRVSPQSAIVSQRISTLCELADSNDQHGRVIIASVSAFLQRVPARQTLVGASRVLKLGDRSEISELTGMLDGIGYHRSGTVMEAGEYAVRGGIVDVFPSGLENPVRLDFFGDELEAIRPFDAASQRSETADGATNEISLRPVSEVLLNDAAISRFRSAYRVRFGKGGDDDPLYGTISAGQRYVGMEHWLPFFHEKLETLLDYLPGAAVVFDHQTIEARDARLDMIAEYFSARCDFAIKDGGGEAAAYRPVPPETMFLDKQSWADVLDGRRQQHLSPFSGIAGREFGGRTGHDFGDARVNPEINVFDAVADQLAAHIKADRRTLIAAHTDGSRDRLQSLLVEHGVEGLLAVATMADLSELPSAAIGLAALPMESGFIVDDLAVLTEQDILGERIGRATRQRFKAENFIAEASSLAAGDLVVHIDHGVGRFDGLETIAVSGAPHDCLRLVYAGEDKLFIPVENIEVISRFGSEDAGAQLDRLGGAGWQARKAKLKGRIRDMAGELIKVAAARTLKRSPRIPVPAGIFEEFCAKFPYAETEDQGNAIADVLDDLAQGRPTDRLVCGDVGFGKTEVALRAAFAVAMDGKQVAIIVPTTLLCRQHLQTFRDRFADFPVRVEQMSRLVTAKHIKTVKAGLADGTVDIVVGTHALLAKDIRFRDIGLLIVDEEQHFGVAHKEKLKKLKSDVHVLTLTATPIPRTLQLALTGVREMSLIATPPVDRLAVRTYIMPYDPVIVREAIMRERFRGGQIFYVCPRVADLPRIEEQLRELAPEARLAVAHGQMSVNALEDAISGFYDGEVDILLSTNIVESGLDLPTVNTIFIHRADMFGLAQLYQLRGRVGRSKTRAYAYLTLPPGKALKPAAQKRLEVMQTLDSLGAGFSLASHDLDIRGAGNLLGDEQSGHIREVGIELYQRMLEEAVAEARGGDSESSEADEWSPQISVGLSVMIPEFYVADLSVRMGLYRRLAWLNGREEIDAFAAEMIDRFGSLPDEVENLIQVVLLKSLCRRCGVEKVDAGPKGAVVSFRNQSYANPVGLVHFITHQAGTTKLRPDHKLVYMRRWDDGAARIEGVRYLLNRLVEIAEAEPG